MSLRDRIQQEVDMLAKMGVPALMQRFLLNVGTECRAAPLPAGFKRGEAKMCFRNATHLAIDDPSLRYVEGYGYIDKLPRLIHHAWCIDEEGNVIDPTWNDPEKREYFGFVFPPSVNIGREVIKNKHYGFLQGPVMINVKFMARFDPTIKKILDKRGKRG